MTYLDRLEERLARAEVELADAARAFADSEGGDGPEWVRLREAARTMSLRHQIVIRERVRARERRVAP